VAVGCILNLIMQKPRTNYITNKDLLAEIARSKRSYCFFERPEYGRYDVIVPSVDAITPEIIAQARTIRAKFGDGTEPVFRIMTEEHIPLEGLRKRRAKGAVVTDRVNFPPFKHYVVRDETGAIDEVGRSHWIGSISNGQFAVNQGRTSNQLARMLMLLVDRYSKRGNWRGYCVDEETEALTQRGWLRHDQITEQDLILSYDAGQLKWSKIHSIFRDQYDGLMFKMTVQGIDALVTPRHKFVTQRGLIEAEYLCEKDKVILTGDPVDGPETPVHSDAFVELVGWVVTEGTIYNTTDRAYPRITVYQNAGPKADRIRDCLLHLGVNFGESGKHTRAGNKNVAFTLTKDLCEKIVGVIDRTDKVLTMPFLLSLTQAQRLLLIETMVDADGFRHAKHLRRYLQKSRTHADAFVTLCTLAGIRTSLKYREIVSFGKPTSIYQVTLISKRGAKHAVVEHIDFHGGKRNGTVKGKGKLYHPNEPSVPYKGLVWCPQTEYGSFMARRGDYVYLTGNTYVEEMKGQALLQLSQIALQFDESKGDNPFAFYTTVIRNCFTRVLHSEKKNQTIRDDLLIMAGARPSFTRQIEDEMEQRAANMAPGGGNTN